MSWVGANPKSEAGSPKQIQSTKAEMTKTAQGGGVLNLEALGIGLCFGIRISGVNGRTNHRERKEHKDEQTGLFLCVLRVLCG
jgi:hypothetical protein